MHSKQQMPTKSLLCQQIIATTTLKSTQTKEKFNIYHKISCKSNYVIYLLECLLCKIQNAGKLETPFHIRLKQPQKQCKKSQRYQSMQIF